MNKGTRQWLHGLGAAFIGGGASSVTAGFTANAIAPEAFNLGHQLGRTFLLILITFIANGIISGCFYLKQSPLPPDDEDAPAKP